MLSKLNRSGLVPSLAFFDVSDLSPPNGAADVFDPARTVIGRALRFTESSVLIHGINWSAKSDRRSRAVRLPISSGKRRFTTFTEDRELPGWNSTDCGRWAESRTTDPAAGFRIVPINSRLNDSRSIHR